MENLPKSTLIKDQKKSFIKEIFIDGKRGAIILNLRYDDKCDNNHNTFSITGEIYESTYRPYEDKLTLSSGKNVYLSSCGCIHKEIEKYFPDFKHLIKWHGCTSEGPLHYIANTLYHANRIEKYLNFVYLTDSEFNFDKLLGIFSDDDAKKLQEKYINIRIEKKPNPMNKDIDIESARKTAIWPDGTIEDLQDKEKLLKRLPELMQEFKKDMENLGFVY